MGIKMLRKDLAVGKYVTNNRWLNDYWRGNNNLMEIVELPKGNDDKLVACKLVAHNGRFSSKTNGYDHVPLIFVPYIHLHEIKERDSFRGWKVGDVIVPTKFGMKNNYALRNGGVYLITKIELDEYTDDKRFLAKRIGGMYEKPANPIYFTKSDTVKPWRGLFAAQYYKGNIKFNDDGELVKPASVVKGSPIYNQIIGEAKTCGIIKG